MFQLTLLLLLTALLILAIPSLPPFAARKRKAVDIPGVNHAMRLTNRSAAVSPALVESLLLLPPTRLILIA